MAKRSYQQHCGLAVALDVVGERWALLIVRDLAPGPRRFTDLFEGLPGIATDMLAERLRSLEAAGAVEQRTVKHPVPGNVYALTERGEELARIGGALARWGMPLLPERGRSSAGSHSGHRSNPRWALQAMAGAYTGGLPDGEYRWTIGDDELRTDVRGNVARLRYGHGVGEPVVHAHFARTSSFFALLRRPMILPRDLLVEGRGEQLERLFASMPLVADGRRSVRSGGRLLQ